MDYGNFLDTIINFSLIIGFVMLVNYLTNVYNRRKQNQVSEFLSGESVNEDGNNQKNDRNGKYQE
ncbi:hypothetical protein BHU72_00340 [Desulfuribacillus stibiiarsenatis]|uniref:Uncharacterized protein n=1 Tax=Desulfuribacillus stibiiarsenatis TaxID=1390249 RepID=A0A1E5L9M7_9FIRM|nr:hypothetical protein [Desulfuribacillus stibiiarsenatis]OEH86758.1 hypothetical protein BHU72_00340 [Desulfuribacillus stibiiarsenatis]